MKVSIITSCYNREQTIRSTIESLLAQDYCDIEYIVVDGASQDSSLSIINEYRDQITTILTEPDRGMYEAINKGIRLATGDVVGLLHSDDTLYSSDTISKIVHQLTSTEADLLYGDGLFVDSEDPTRVVRRWISGAFDRGKMSRGWLPLHTTLYLRRGCFERLGYYDESYKIAADSDLLVRYMYESNLRVTYLNEYILRMRMGGLSTDPKRMRDKFEEDWRLYRHHGFNPLWTILCKMLSKVPQFVTVKLKDR